ncbi:MAG: 16S rRNA (guanine(966)-N(2))-methyltransferase RsmD [Nocardioidaceae bacterium]|nr:16S rRNA (guanine(966)-N(2))-methyltransferase RsmD [Nocardioidaceae bacterium]
MTRIIAGSAGGRQLRVPRGINTRPTSDRVREALFSALEARLGSLAGARFLDVYAGSGAVGLEARSRGATYVRLVEHDVATAALIRDNAERLGFDGIEVVTAKAERLLAVASGGSGFEVAFFDPPYAVAAADVGVVVGGLWRAGWLCEDAVVVVERSRREDEWEWPAGLEGMRVRRYGETMLWYGRATGSPRPLPVDE